MKLVMVAVKDLAAEAYTIPQFVGHANVAMRSFRDAINDPQSQYHKHPEDFELYSLGEYDDELAAFAPTEPFRLARGKDLIATGG